MSPKKAEYTCIREKQINKHSDDITELKARADFKDKRIDDLATELKEVSSKLDGLDEKLTDIMLKSVQDGNNLNQRVTSLENTVQVLKWIVTLVFGSGLLWIVISMYR